ncbi:hypothetical protein [uncultured Roseibium sp.]|nr:hypothetical protein [uncultured Roseibium sp.]
MFQNEETFAADKPDVDIPAGSFQRDNMLLIAGIALVLLAAGMAMSSALA